MESLGMKKVGIFYGHLKYITAIWYILWPFGNFVVSLVYFPHFGILNKEKSGNPGWDGFRNTGMYLSPAFCNEKSKKCQCQEFSEAVRGVLLS
jgi:hypothetical protein